jgi:hypothetical protein
MYTVSGSVVVSGIQYEQVKTAVPMKRKQGSELRTTFMPLEGELPYSRRWPNVSQPETVSSPQPVSASDMAHRTRLHINVATFFLLRVIEPVYTKTKRAALGDRPSRATLVGS